MSRPRAADDFATIRARLDELHRARNGAAERSDPPPAAPSGRQGDAERRRRERIDGAPPPWIPTIFVRNPLISEDSPAKPGETNEAQEGTRC